MEQQVDQETEEVVTHPYTMSERGENAYYMGGCDVVEHNPSYAACLNKIVITKNRKKYPEAYTHLKTLSDSCISAIKSGRCRAVGMREEEELKGIAIYFKPRIKPDSATSSGWDRNKTSPFIAALSKTPFDKSPPFRQQQMLMQQGRTSTDKPAPIASKGKPKSSVIDLIDNTSYSDAINASAKQKEQPKPAAPAVKMEAKAGESLLEMARRLMAQQSTN